MLIFTTPPDPVTLAYNALATVLIGVLEAMEPIPSTASKVTTLPVINEPLSNIEPPLPVPRSFAVILTLDVPALTVFTLIVPSAVTVISPLAVVTLSNVTPAMGV